MADTADIEAIAEHRARAHDVANPSQRSVLGSLAFSLKVPVINE